MKAVAIFGWGILITSYITMMATFLLAVLNPAGVVIRVNLYGEAWWELLLLLAGLPCVLFLSYRFLHGKPLAQWSA